VSVATKTFATPRNPTTIIFEITLFDKRGGPLTKKITLGTDGKPVSDASECLMSQGTVTRTRLPDLRGVARLIAGLKSHQAIASGSLRAGLPDRVEITTSAKLGKVNGTATPHLIARTTEYIVFVPGQVGLVLVDYDMKGMPAHVRQSIAELGGFHAALCSVVPGLATAGCITRRSTSAGLYRTDTGEQFPESGGLHVYILVLDVADSGRFLKTLHERCWLAGLGWMMVGAGGQLLERSLVDRVVGSPERLVFEADPILVAPVAQDKAKRQPIVTEGAVLDTAAACPPLSILEQAKLHELRAKEAWRLAPEVAKAREGFIGRQSGRLAEQTGIDVRHARRVIERQCDGVLLPDLVLPFDDPELSGTTVAAVLADPERFEGVTLADPLEGVDYGRCKARIMRSADGTPWVHSFAHGRTTYSLKRDARAAAAILQIAPKDEAAATFVRLGLAGDLDEDEVEELRNLAHERSGVGKRALDKKLKGAATARTSAVDQIGRDGTGRTDRAPYRVLR
jgi:hypothetical protein